MAQETGLPTTAAVTSIYLVYKEYQKDTPEIERAFVNEKDAYAYAMELEEQLTEDGMIVWGRDEDDDWDVDVHVEEVTLEHSTRPVV